MSEYHAVTVRGVNADDLAIHAADFELCAFQPCAAALVRFEDGQSLDGRVGKGQGLGIAGIHLHRLGNSVQYIAVWRCRLRYHQRCAGFHASDVDLPVFIGGVNAVGADGPACIGNITSIRGDDLELRSG